MHRILDWDDAYANAIHIPGGEAFPARWADAAAAFRHAHPPKRIRYGAGERNWMHLFLPEAAPVGLSVFVHGGWWMAFEPGTWSHLAAGALARGWAVAMPAYTLAPAARIAAIGAEIAAAIGLAAESVAGPVVLAGHSAGGQLVARMVCAGTPLAEEVARRVVRIAAISPLTDLRPLMRLTSNANLRIDPEEALAESPALLLPGEGFELSVRVGAAERHEFIRQARLLADLWGGLGVPSELVVEPDRHHFDIVEGLADPDHPLCDWLFPA